MIVAFICGIGAIGMLDKVNAAVPNIALVDDFEGGSRNAMDGSHGRFQSGASKVDILCDTTIFHGSNRGTSLRIRAD